VRAKMKWSDLSPRQQRLITVGVVYEAALKIAALIDIKRRPADQIRGSKRTWAIIVVAVNSVGLAPIAYFRFGRRRSED